LHDKGHFPHQPNQKIVSLLPSGTEIVLALGLGHRLVGISDFCEIPPGVLEGGRVPARAVRSLVDVMALNPEEVEEAMAGFKARGVSPFEIDVELLKRERPGLVITQVTEEPYCTRPGPPPSNCLRPSLLPFCTKWHFPQQMFHHVVFMTA
jgi:ABC-type Fe3+-hydroxamate transport system substrate-binding protein